MFWNMAINNVKWNMPNHQYGLQSFETNQILSWSEFFFSSRFWIFMNAGGVQMDWTQIASSENLLILKAECIPFNHWSYL